MSSGLSDIGMIHGRFQPFHIGHLRYLKDALALTRLCLLVGVTNPDLESQSVADSSDPHRHTPEANPFSFVDRARMVSRSVELDLKHRGLPVVLPVPFNVHATETWGWIPRDTLQFVNVLEPWDEVKVDRFRQYGFVVKHIPHEREYSGSGVRAMIKNEQDVAKYVPSGTMEVLTELGITNQLP